MNTNTVSTILQLNTFRYAMAMAFSSVFFLLCVLLAGMSLDSLIASLFGPLDFKEGFLRAINLAVVSLAMFELGLVVVKEYAQEHEHEDIISVVRRTVSRFVSIVCIALVLEGLLMVIKYSQLELAGNLYYPVAIVVSASILLMALGIFLRFTQGMGCSVTCEPDDDFASRKRSHRLQDSVRLAESARVGR